MSHSLICAQIMNWALELIPVWETPVSVSMLHKAHPEFSRPTYAAAMKQLVEAGMLDAVLGERDQVFYQPASWRPRCLIQEWICKGRIDPDDIEKDAS